MKQRDFVQLTPNQQEPNSPTETEMPWFTLLGSAFSWFAPIERIHNAPKTGWWFQTCSIFRPIWRRFPFWPIFSKWFENTAETRLLLGRVCMFFSSCKFIGLKHLESARPERCVAAIPRLPSCTKTDMSFTLSNCSIRVSQWFQDIFPAPFPSIDFVFERKKKTFFHCNFLLWSMEDESQVGWVCEMLLGRCCERWIKSIYWDDNVWKLWSKHVPKRWVLNGSEIQIHWHHDRFCIGKGRCICIIQRIVEKTLIFQKQSHSHSDISLVGGNGNNLYQLWGPHTSPARWGWRWENCRWEP